MYMIKRCQKEAARARWLTAPYLAIKKRAALSQDLKLLARVIRGMRSALRLKRRREADRCRALVYFHVKGKEARRIRNGQRSLASAFRRAVASGIKIREKNRVGLEKIYRRVLWRQNNKIESRLANRLRRRFEKAFKHRKTSRICAELTGTSVAALRVHLEAQFKPGMSWENYGFEGWHIDHIRPVCSFQLTDPAQQRACFHYTNLQPLWKNENLAKGKKFQKSV
jgi:hypothetical protein